jgi:phage repressor protein C with HTH and peptisase S24 domain
MTIGKRIARARDALGFTQERLAEMVGVGQSTVADWETGKTTPRHKTLEKVVTALNTSMNYILLGQELGPVGGVDPNAKASTSVSGALTDAPATAVLHGEEFRAIPVYDIRAAAGAGAQNHGAEEPITWSVFRTEWLRRVSRTPDLLSVLRVTGDSMHPTLHDGDTVLIDRGVRNVGRDGIYILRLGDDVQCKRCSRHPTTGILTIASDNQRYPTYTDIRPDSAGLEVIGRVIWTGRGM